MNAQEQAAFHAKVAGLIGLDPALVALHRGRVGEAVFANSLLAARGKVLDLYDGTQPSENPKPEVRDGFGATLRTLEVFSGTLLPPFMNYVRNDLGYATDRPYIVLNLEVTATKPVKAFSGSEAAAEVPTFEPSLTIIGYSSSALAGSPAPSPRACPRSWSRRRR